MEKINDFRILELTISGFKGFPEPRTFHFDYGVNFILGDNGLGKTTIAEAIAFAFMGTGFFGEKTLDRLQNGDAKEAFVSVKFTDGAGEVHELAKTRKNNANGITYDGYNVRQTDLYNLFGDKELFLSMFNPLYFIETLGTDGKNLLEKLLPAVSHEAVLAALPEETREALQGENILSPETYIKNRRAEVKELEEDLIYMQGQADLLEEGAKKAQAELDTAKTGLAAKTAQLQKLEELLPDAGQRESLRLEIAELESCSKQEMADALHRKEELREQISDTNLRLCQAKETAFSFPDDAEIIRLEMELKAKYAQYDAANKHLRRLRAGLKCPICLHEMTEEDVPAARKVWQKHLEQCVSAGKAAKAELKSLKQGKETALQEFQEMQAAETARLEETIAALETQYRGMAEGSITANRLSYLKAALEYGSLLPEQAAELDTLRQECRELETKIRMLSETLEQPDMQGQMESIRQEIDVKKLRISQAVNYWGKKNELLFVPLQMNRASISLSEAMKTTGEMKDTFKFAYDGKSYAKLSLSEKMRAGLEIAELVKRLSGRRYPTFLDNGESVSVIDNVRPTGQMMISKVTKGKPLTVLSRNGTDRDTSDNVRKAA